MRTPVLSLDVAFNGSVKRPATAIGDHIAVRFVAVDGVITGWCGDAGRLALIEYIKATTAREARWLTVEGVDALPPNRVLETEAAVVRMPILIVGGWATELVAVSSRR